MNESWDAFIDSCWRGAHAVAPPPEPAPIQPRLEPLPGVRVVLWDLYGTLLAAPTGDIETSLDDEVRLNLAFRATAERFGWTETTIPQPPINLEAAIATWYFEGIDTRHAEARRRGVISPEVIIEEVWEDILSNLESLGWSKAPQGRQRTEIVRRVAYFFECTYNRTALYPGSYPVLRAINRAGLAQGIVSNAQFYTPTTLTRLLAAASEGEVARLEDIFDYDLVFFSYQLGVSKPNTLMFERAAEALRRRGIETQEALVVENDMVNDVAAAQTWGFRTALFAGDARTVRLDEAAKVRGVVPDVTLTALSQLPLLLGLSR